MQEEKRPAAEPADWERALDGLDFPAAKVAIVRETSDRGGLDREVIQMLERVPKDEYETRDDLVADVRALYAEDGFDTANLPI
jgi:hypothetical protein